jgi:hypothetical protein
MICNNVWRVNTLQKTVKMSFYISLGTTKNGVKSRKRATESRVGHRWKSFSGPPARENQMKIFTLNRQQRFLIAGGLRLDMKGLICTIDKFWYYWGRQKHVQNRWVLVICTGFPPPPRPINGIVQKSVKSRKYCS